MIIVLLCSEVWETNNVIQIKKKINLPNTMDLEEEKEQKKKNRMKPSTEVKTNLDDNQIVLSKIEFFS